LGETFSNHVVSTKRLPPLHEDYHKDLRTEPKTFVSCRKPTKFSEKFRENDKAEVLEEKYHY
uniref:Uncharacterized protein n=1 Tax=Romanomermis culicivorax TaxID=13658 RepID=A0A915IRX0_ROMCU